jgi:thiamine pyrophosphate-dependent acetolactate synthase large subunit-like protein
MAERIADVLVDVLAETGVRRIYGLPGDALNEEQFRQVTFRYRLM